mmetsp:Transcript_981/g.2163  ORF Transcript_981/g.2163 Transcript_981/m.2163 type:complete len:222 (-) Transcript_981:116-781(-)
MPSVQESKGCAGTPSLLRFPATMRMDIRSPKEIRASIVRGVSSPMFFTPSRRRSRLSSSSDRDLSVLSGNPRAVAVPMCIVRRESTSTCPCKAKSPALTRVLVVLPIAEQMMIGRYPISTCFFISFVTYVILSGLAMEDPPNFMTILFTPSVGGRIWMSSPTVSRTLLETSMSFRCSSVIARFSDSVDAPANGASLRARVCTGSTENPSTVIARATIATNA